MSRINVIERDISGFTSLVNDETGAMVVKSSKGKSTPMFLQSEEDCLRELGKPSAEYPGVFEAIAFTRKAPLYCVSAIGSGALYGGVDVLVNNITGFGVGRDYSNFNYGTTTKGVAHAAGIGNGVTATFTGTFANTPITDVTDFSIYVNGFKKTATLSVGGTLSGSDISSGSVNLSTGAWTVTFAGVAGSYATITTNVDGSSNYNLSSGGTNKYIKITVDNTVVDNINLGSSATTTRASIISAINAAIGFTCATTSGNFIVITGRKGSINGIVTVEAPSLIDGNGNAIAGNSALTLVFSSGGTILTDLGSNPTLAIPRYNEAIVMNYHYTQDTSALVSHSFFTTSQYTDDLACSVQYLSGSKFKMKLYKNMTTGYSLIKEYSYSLIREKDAFGNSLYYADVFEKDSYVQFKINPVYTDTAYILPGTAIVAFSGGYRGADPSIGNFTSAWNNFQYSNKYRAKIFMDVYGTHASTINTLCQDYQPWAQGITCIPLGNDAVEALSFRSSIGLDTDDNALYTNWTKIRDDYNNSFAWISNIGSIGKKYAMMVNTYDAASPAGIDENGHGGQLNDWTVVEVENDYTQSELDNFRSNQINPIIFDQTYGLMAYGDQTLQVTNSDTSFIGTRRLYKLIIDVISKQILRKQEFKLNDPLHRLMAKTQTDNFLSPIIADGWIRTCKVICDETNNTDVILNARQFILDLYIRIMPNSQEIQLRLTRLPQNTVTVNEITI